jgi:hypothetical protein
VYGRFVLGPTCTLETVPCPCGFVPYMAGVFGELLPARGAELVTTDDWVGAECVTTELDEELCAGAPACSTCFSVLCTALVSFGTTLRTDVTVLESDGLLDPRLVSGSASRIASDAPTAIKPCVARRIGVDAQLPCSASCLDPWPNDIGRLPYGR